MIPLCVKFEINSAWFSEQKGVTNISVDALNKFDSIMGETLDNIPVNIDALDLFDVKIAIDKLSSNNIRRKLVKIDQCTFEKVGVIKNELSLDDCYDEIYNRNEEEFSFDLQDYEETIGLLNSFSNDNWTELSVHDKIVTIECFYDTLCKELKIQIPPNLCFCVTDPQFCGGFDNKNDRVVINLAYIDLPNEIANTIAHELWHTHQFEEAKNGDTYQSKLYALNFNKYISAKTDFYEYEGQLLEAEARAFANQILERNV